MSEGPTLVPSYKMSGAVYILLDDFGKLGRVYRETGETAADAETVIRGLLLGEYHLPTSVVAFNTDEGWSIDASQEIAAAVVDIAHERQCTVGRATIEFLEEAYKASSGPCVRSPARAPKARWLAEIDEQHALPPHRLEFRSQVRPV